MEDKITKGTAEYLPSHETFNETLPYFELDFKEKSGPVALKDVIEEVMPTLIVCFNAT